MNTTQDNPVSDREATTEILNKLDDLPLEKAVTALKKYIKNKQDERQTTSLIGDSQGLTISLIFSLEKISETIRSRPLPIKLPHSMNKTVSDVCVIVRDPQRKWKDLFAQHSIPEVQKIIGITKLRKKFSTYQSKRELCSSFEEFYCDDRIVHRMPSLLGKVFVSSKKLPIGLKIREHDVSTPVRQALDSTWLKIRCGSTSAVRIGRSNMSIEEIVENAKAVIKEIVNFYVKDGRWQNSIRSIFLQSTNSIAIPIYTTIDIEALKASSETQKSTTNKEKKNDTKKRVSTKHIKPLKKKNKKTD